MKQRWQWHLPVTEYWKLWLPQLAKPIHFLLHMPQHLSKTSSTSLDHHEHFWKKSSISKPSIKFEAFEHTTPNFLAGLPVLSMVVIQDFTAWLSPPVIANQTLGVSLSARSISLRMYIFTHIDWLIDFYVKVHTYIIYVSIYVLCVTYITYWVWFDVPVIIQNLRILCQQFISHKNTWYQRLRWFHSFV